MHEAETWYDGKLIWKVHYVESEVKVDSHHILNMIIGQARCETVTLLAFRLLTKDRVAYFSEANAHNSSNYSESR